MKQALVLALLAATLATSSHGAAQSAGTNAVIHAQPLHAGHINPRLFGNFIELLDDVVPSLWAEMLNDRTFEGVKRVIDPIYFDGAPGLCDRDWDQNSTWTFDTENPFNGTRSAKLMAIRKQPASLTQSGLAVKRGMTYACSGWLRAEPLRLKATLLLKTLLPTGDWMTLARAKLPPMSSQWTRYAVELKSAGETDRAVFELRVEGEGNVWADKLSVMPTDNLSGWRHDAVAAIRELQPKLIRWGGSVCDPGEYRWKNGIGARDARVPFTNKNWGRIDSNDVGIDEFCQLCELTGLEPLICVSFSDGPQSAADLVEYCNGDARTAWGAKRVAHGHPAPYPIKNWQVGNEISGDDPKYLDQFGTFVSLMKKADPGVVLMCSFPTQKLLERYGKDIAYVGPHHYTRNLVGCETDFNQIAEMIRRIPGCAHIKIAVTEWNESAGDWGLGRGRQMALQNALHNARYMNLMMRHSDTVEIACRSSIANSFCGGLIQTSPSGLLKRPGYYALQLYARHAKPIPLRVEQPEGDPDFFACASEDKKSVAIFAVNSKARPIAWTFMFDGFNSAVRSTTAKTLCDTLNARQPDAMNHWAAPERIKVVQLASSPGIVTLPPLSVTVIECEMK
jgi:alpha-N-arabinofuranosidase